MRLGKLPVPRLALLAFAAAAAARSEVVDVGENGFLVKETVVVVGGYNRGGFRELAPGVEGVLAAQIGRDQRYAATGKP